MDMGKETRGTGLNSKLDQLIEIFAPKTKQGKLPKLPKLKKAKLKMNYALVIYLMDNLNMEAEYVKIDNDYIYIKKTNTFHLATSKYVCNYKGIPTIFQPTWRLEPFCPSTDYEHTIANHGGSNPQKVLITLMEQTNLKIKGKMGGKAILWIIIGVVAALYLISKLLGKA